MRKIFVHQTSHDQKIILCWLTGIRVKSVVASEVNLEPHKRIKKSVVMKYSWSMWSLFLFFAQKFQSIKDPSLYTFFVCHCQWMNEITLKTSQVEILVMCRRILWVYVVYLHNLKFSIMQEIVLQGLNFSNVHMPSAAFFLS